MSDLHIFDPHDRRLAILSNEAENACPFWDAPFKEELNKGSSFRFTVPANHPDSAHIVAENKVAFRDKDDRFRLFVIKETEENDGEGGPVIDVYCDPEWLDELNDVVIEDKRPQNRTAEYALGQVLEDSRWEVGEVAELGINSTNFYFMTAIESINRIIDVWGGEIRDRIKVEGNRITGRYIDLLTRRGADTGKRWEIDKDIINIARIVQSYPKTALYGRGASLETEGGGFSRLLTFEDVEWSVANGDPVDKPLGQKWVGDPDALYKYGRRKNYVEPIDGSTPRVYSEQDKYDPSNAYIHRFGIYENGSIEDPEELLWATWNELQEQKRPFENYTLDVLLYAEKAGLDHEKVRLGDTTIALDRRFARPIEVEERIIAYEYDIANPDDTGKVELGQFRELFSDDKRLDKIQAQLDSAQGKANHPEIDDSTFPDIKPDTPTGFTADGLFKVIQLKWDYDASSYIAAYELYASQSQGFEPTPDRLVWRGKTGGYAFEAETDEQWYFRLRAVNTHGTASDFTDEVQANTVKVHGSVDVEPLTITDQLISHDANIDFAKIANVEITDAMIVNLSADKVTGGNFGGETFVGGVFIQEGTDGTLYVDDEGVKFYDKDNDLRAAILIGGTEGIENALGLTLADKGESVFEINQDGEKASIFSKIDLELDSEKDILLRRQGQDIMEISGNGQINIPTKALSRGISFNEHVITRHNTDDSLAIYPSRTGKVTGDPIFRVRSHDGKDNFQENLRIDAQGAMYIRQSVHMGAGTPDSTIFSIANSGTSSGGWSTTFHYKFWSSTESRIPMWMMHDEAHLMINYSVSAPGISSSTLSSNMRIGSNGEITKVKSSQRYKLVPESMKVDPYKLLDLNPIDWYDKNNVEEYAELLTKQENGEDVELKGEKIRRIPGLAAEDVVAAGLEEFVEFNENDDDDPEGVMYDRLWTLLIPIVREQQSRIKKIERVMGIEKH